MNFLEAENKNEELSDSAIINLDSQSILQTIDHIKLFSSLNPFDFGVISYFHSQNDILSGGGSVKSLSVSLGVPFSKGIVEDFLKYFMQGIKEAANEDGSTISSGHSYLSNEPGITITMNGSIHKKLDKRSAKISNLISFKASWYWIFIISVLSKFEILNSDDFKKLIKWLKKVTKMRTTLLTRLVVMY